MKLPFGCLLLICCVLAGCGKTAPAEQSPTAKDQRVAGNEAVAAITLKRITSGEKPILYVTHDDEGDWQFLDGGDVSEKDATIISLKQIEELDPTIKAILDLPPGWSAVRVAKDKPWRRFES
ncbi:hypothetical protein [Anatilimnocola floriformis]|uniref:hypothetical protein n=1 Tax=Anatilimnocola floriformis TaxID=2948575 RepID=UPI0020C1BAB3|nr:hypothetical protein [Anatilimnocola floriformis]